MRISIEILHSANQKLQPFRRLQLWLWVVTLIALLSLGLWSTLQPAFRLHAASAELATALTARDNSQQLMAAVARLEQLRIYMPAEPLVYRRLAQGYTALNRPQEALYALEEAYRLSPASLLIQ